MHATRRQGQGMPRGTCTRPGFIYRGVLPASARRRRAPRHPAELGKNPLTFARVVGGFEFSENSVPNQETNLACFLQSEMSSSSPYYSKKRQGDGGVTTNASFFLKGP